MGPYTASAIDMLDFFERQQEWSYETFGNPSVRGPKGPLDHLQKESKEAYEESDPEKQKEEIIDCLFLVFDAAHRSGMSYSQIAKMAMEKLRKNKQRVWPPIGATPPDKATEHDRSAE